MNQDIYIVDGLRTPQLKTRGAPGPFRASDLAHASAQALLLKLGLAPTALDEVILGCVAPGPDEANIARVVALRLGCREQTPAWTVQRNCASGLQAIDAAANHIRLGRSELVLAGGTESMSHHPVLLNNAMVAWLGRWSSAHGLLDKLRTLGQLRGKHLKPVIGLLRGLTDPVVGLSMGQTAEELAYRFAISREAMDRFALRSHQRLAAAIEQQNLDEITPIYDKKGQVYLADDGLRAESSLSQLGQLKPVFDRFAGAVTAGNSAQVTDGACCLLLASAEAVKRYQLPVIGRIVDQAWAGLAPEQMGLGPVHAMAPIMQRQGLDSNDIDIWEINEAFAAQVLACLKAWQDKGFSAINEEHLNIDGGGISLGHPVGASGARIVLHCLKVLQRKQGHYGMASLCIGGGQGGAMLLEAVNSVEGGEI
jgi:acetyl-CoA C-acetyltransferase